MGAWLTGLAGSVALLAGIAFGIWALVVPAIAAVGVIVVLLRQARIAPVYQRSRENYRRAREAIVGKRLQSP